MFEGYLALGGLEIASQARVAAYMAPGATQGVACGCPDLPVALGHAPYTTPDADPAPWYHPSEPESAGFGGLWVEEIEGLHTAPYSRSGQQRLGDGAMFPRLRASDRELVVTGWLFARDKCSADWGLRWLTSSLTACQGCDGVDLCLFRCCPATPEDVERELRTLHNARLIQGPEVIQTAQMPELADCAEGTRPAYRVQFTLSTDPYYWRAPVALIDELVWPAPDPDADCNITWDVSGECDPSNPGCIPGVNSPLPGCAANPYCPPPPAPPRVPTATTGCVCIPLYVVRQCATITADQIPPQFTTALRFRIYAGDQDVRNLSISIYQNPRQLPPEDLDDCRVCGTYYIEYIPAESTLVVDGTTNSARMLCPGAVNTRADHVLFGDGGGPVQHVTLQCNMSYTICADMDVESFSPLATLAVEAVTREA